MAALFCYNGTIKENPLCALCSFGVVVVVVVVIGCRGDVGSMTSDCLVVVCFSQLLGNNKNQTNNQKIVHFTP